jgi:hypothetical protein
MLHLSQQHMKHNAIVYINHEIGELQRRVERLQRLKDTDFLGSAEAKDSDNINGILEMDVALFEPEEATILRENNTRIFKKFYNMANDDNLLTKCSAKRAKEFRKKARIKFEIRNGELIKIKTEADMVFKPVGWTYNRYKTLWENFLKDQSTCYFSLGRDDGIQLNSLTNDEQSIWFEPERL